MNNHQGTSLNKALPPRLLRLELFPFMDGWMPLCSMGLSVLQNCTLPQNRASIQSLDFMSWFVFRHALSTIEPYIDKCVVFQSMSSQLNLSQVDSTKVGETSGC